MIVYKQDRNNSFSSFDIELLNNFNRLTYLCNYLDLVGIVDLRFRSAVTYHEWVANSGGFRLWI